LALLASGGTPVTNKQERRLPAIALCEGGLFFINKVFYSLCMHRVYILKSIPYPKQIYIGFSSVDMETRLERHNQGGTSATRR